MIIMKRYPLFCLVYLFFVVILLTSHNYMRCEKVSENKSVPDTILISPWGMNSHLTFNCSKNYVEELCKSMAEAGVDIIRLDIYWWYSQMYMQQDLCDRAVYYADKYGLDILLNFPQLPNRVDDEFLYEWLNMLYTYVVRYNGKNSITIEGEDIPRYPRVRFIEVMNEIELKYKNQKIDVKDAFKLIKCSAEKLRSLPLTDRPLVVFPGISPMNNFVKELFEYTEKGKTVVDYIDIINAHIYTKTTRDFIYTIQLWKSFREKNHCNNKPFWITELGNSLWDVTETVQAENLFKQYVLSIAYGVERIFYYQYHSFGGNYFKNVHQKEEFYGIIENSASKSFVSFLENDGVYKTALSEGDGLGKIFIADSLKASIYTITDKMCKKLKDNGVAIGGKGYTINKITIKKCAGNEHVLWKGKWSISNSQTPLRLPCEVFENITPQDNIVVYVSNVKGYKEWQGVKPMLAYSTYQYLSSILNKGSTRPVVCKETDGLIKVSWKYKNSYFYVLWYDKEKTCKMNIYCDNFYISDLKGKKKRMKHNPIIISKTPCVIVSAEDIKLFLDK